MLQKCEWDLVKYWAITKQSSHGIDEHMNQTNTVAMNFWDSCKTSHDFSLNVCIDNINLLE